MGNTSFLPARESELVTWTENFDLKINATPTTYGLTAAQAAAYTPASTAFVEAYKACNTDSTNSRTAIITKNDAKKVLIASARQLSRIVQSFPGTTNTMRAELGLTVPATPTPTPWPDVAPVSEILTVDGRRVQTATHAAGSTRRSRAPGMTGALVYSYVGDTYPSDPALWQFEGIATRSKFEVIFPDSVPAGATVWICAAWVNRRGEAGPVSKPVSVNLQGGGSNTVTKMQLAA
ncbi:MAG: hypothetical protein ACTHLN_04075 [Tepidisphaeraceae bacterium]